MWLCNFLSLRLSFLIDFSFSSVVSYSLWPHEPHAACQASLSITNSRSPPKPMSIELVMPSHHLILCHPLLLLTSVFPTIRVFSNGSVLGIRWPKDWSFSFLISPSNEYSGLISIPFLWFDLLAVGESQEFFSSTTVQKHQFFGTQPSLWPNSNIRTWLLEKP